MVLVDNLEIHDSNIYSSYCTYKKVYLKVDNKFLEVQHVLI